MERVHYHGHRLKPGVLITGNRRQDVLFGRPLEGALLRSEEGVRGKRRGEKRGGEGEKRGGEGEKRGGEGEGEKRREEKRREEKRREEKRREEE